MQVFRKLAETRVNDLVRFQNNGLSPTFKVLRIEKSEGIQPDTLRRRPNIVRTNVRALLQNSLTKQLRWTYAAEFLPVEIVGDFVKSDHAAQRMKNRGISNADLAFVLKYGKMKRTGNNNLKYHISSDMVKFLDDFKHLAGLSVIMTRDGSTVITTFKES